MGFYLLLPILFLRFWFYEAPIGIVGFFKSFNHAFLQLFSLPLFLRTYFKPLKNEYRTGLVGFSIGIGIFIKTILIIVDSMLFILLLFIEGLFLSLFIIWPILTVFILFT